MENKTINARVQFESQPIRHIAVQCPNCGKWFNGNDISDTDISDDYALSKAEFICPVCSETFSPYVNEIDVVEMETSTEVYEGCLQKKEVWK